MTFVRLKDERRSLGVGSSLAGNSLCADEKEKKGNEKVVRVPLIWQRAFGFDGNDKESNATEEMRGRP